MQVFVAGASGGSGKLVVQQLASKGISVRAGVRVSLCSSRCTHSHMIMFSLAIYPLVVAVGLAEQQFSERVCPSHLIV